MAGPISNMMAFNDIADADAKDRRGVVSNMFGGFGPNIEGEGLSPDPYAKTQPEQYPVNYSASSLPGTFDFNAAALRAPLPKTRRY